MIALACAPAAVSANSQLFLLWGYPHSRNNWLFADTAAGAQASAIIYSLMLTCRACGVEPFMYLRHVLTELPQRAPEADVTDLLPFHFARQLQANTPQAP